MNCARAGGPETFAWRAAREFARRLRDPSFRRYARSAGYRAGHRVVLACADETLATVLDRAGTADPGGRGGRPVTVVVYRPGIEPPFAFVDLYGAAVG